MKPTAGYKNKKYVKEWGFAHYGIDCVSASKNRALYGLGDGVVFDAGLDGLNGKTTGKGSGCGYCLIVIYKDCYNWIFDKGFDATVTYMHLAEMPKVKKGDKVTADTLLGYYGNTGAKTSGPHLHVQFDTDIKYPRYCQGITKKGHNFLKQGKVDSTMNPAYFFHRGAGQSVKVGNSEWYEKEDFANIPAIPETSNRKPNRRGNVIVIGLKK